MKVQGIVGWTRGNPHFGIKPYPVVVERPLLALDAKIVFLRVYTPFRDIGMGEFEVDDCNKFQFHPVSVPLTPQLEALYTQLGGNVELLKADFEAYEEAMARSIERQKRKRRMSGEKSLCPGFKKFFDAAIAECKDCKQGFPDEYEACRRACEKNSQADNDGDGGLKATNKEIHTMDPKNPTTATTPETPSTATPTTTPATPAAPAAPKAPKVPKELKTGAFEGFREGSNADLLQKFLAAKGKTTVAEAAAALVAGAKKPIVEKKAIETVKAYLWEWKKGVWAGVVRPFPFTVKVDGANIEYTAKV